MNVPSSSGAVISIGGAVEHVEQQWLQRLGRLSPPAEVEGLESGEGKRVFGVVEEKAVLPTLHPPVKPAFNSPMISAKVESVR